MLYWEPSCRGALKTGTVATTVRLRQTPRMSDGDYLIAFGSSSDPEALREAQGYRWPLGAAGLKAVTGFHDEALAGEWKGYHSSRFGLQYRVIYRALSAETLFQVVSVAAHDYRRT